MPQVTFPLDRLIEDEDIYPRLHVDDVHVGNLASAIRAGEDLQALTPILIDQDLRIVDGWHRVRAFTKVHGPKHTISVTQQTFDSRADVLIASVTANAAHGRKLDERDKTRSIQLLRSEGVGEDQIAVTLHTTTEQVERLSIRVVIVQDKDGGEDQVQPAPRVLWPKAGEPVRRVSADQFKAAQAAPGWTLRQQVRTLRRELEAHLADLDDEEMVAELKQLAAVISKMIRKGQPIS